MKKLLLLILFALSFSSSFAQDDVITEMCGVEFGSDRPTARRILTAKFGEPSDDDLKYLGFEDIVYAGVKFDIAFFTFQNDGTRSYLNDVMLIILCKTAEQAKNVREYLKGILGNKYELSEGIDGNKFKFYQGGTSPTDSDYYGFKLDIRKDNVTKGGGYVVRLEYGDYDYLNESL